MSEDVRSYLPIKDRSGSDSLDPVVLIEKQKVLLRRDAGLYIEREVNDYYRFRGDCSIRDDIRQLEVKRVYLPPEELFSRIITCRNVWYKEVVLRGVPGRYGGAPRRAIGRPPFATQWDLSRTLKKGELERIGARLACAGRNLFRYIFFGKGRAKLAPIGESLQQRSREQPMVVTITSDHHFVPWSLIYTHPGPGKDLDKNGKNFDWMGFWGYRHIIEHDTLGPDTDDLTPIPSPRDPRIKPDSNRKVAVGFSADDGIDLEFDLTTAVADQRRFFALLAGAKATDRSTLAEVERAFRMRYFPDQITYFFCHHEGTGPSERYNRGESRLYLRRARMEQERDVLIEAVDIENWLDHESFRRRPPFVFINGCEGGHMTTVNYQTLARILLDHGALGLLGPQINLPVVFAAEYARRFFSAFLDPASGSPPKKVRVGELVRDLAQQFLEHHNPLGLVYSLYRGLDCYVDWEQQP